MSLKRTVDGCSSAAALLWHHQFVILNAAEMWMWAGTSASSPSMWCTLTKRFSANSSKKGPPFLMS